jgi:hypothetical protein
MSINTFYQRSLLAKFYVYYELNAVDIEGPEPLAECSSLEEAWNVVKKHTNAGHQYCDEGEIISWEDLPVFDSREDMNIQNKYSGKFKIPETWDASTEEKKLVIWIAVDGRDTHFVSDASPRQWGCESDGIDAKGFLTC